MLELLDVRNIFRARNWKAGIRFFPVHLMTLGMLIIVNMSGSRNPGILVFLKAVIFAVNILFLGAWTRVFMLRNADLGETFAVTGLKLFGTSLIPAFSITLLHLLLYGFFRLFVVIGTHMDGSFGSNEGLPLFMTSNGLLVVLSVSLLILPYGAAFEHAYGAGRSSRKTTA